MLLYYYKTNHIYWNYLLVFILGQTSQVGPQPLPREQQQVTLESLSPSSVLHIPLPLYSAVTSRKHCPCLRSLKEKRNEHRHNVN